VFTLDRLSDTAIEEVICKAVHRLSRKADLDTEFDVFLSSPTSSSGTSDVYSSHLASSQSEAPSSQSSTSQGDNRRFTTYPQLSQKVLRSIVSLSTGDARCALSLLDLVISAPSDTLESTLIENIRRSVSSSYDRSGDGRYDMISALHKSVRGGSVDGALYWLARMLGAGEDPMYIARRMVVCASEDIGLADPQALPLVSNFKTSKHWLLI